MPKRVPRQARARATFDAIVDAGARLLATRGYDAFTTNHVAAKAGVSIGSLYEYFPDKETIVAEVARRTIREVVDDLGAGLDAASGREPATGLRELVRAMFAAIAARRDLVAALWRDVHFLSDLDEVKNLRLIVVDLARRWQNDETRPLYARNPEAVTYLVTLMSAHAIIEGVVARPSHLSEAEVEETFADILATLVL